MNRRVTRIDELARDIPPPRDLWPAIHAGITAAGTGVLQATRRRGAWLPAAGLAAGVALVAIGVLIGRNIAPQAAPVVTAAQPATDSGMVPAALRDAEYCKQCDHLLVEV